MKRSPLLRSLVFFLATGLAAASCAEKYALLVGVETYKQSESINSLQAACADAKGIAMALEQVGGFSPDDVRVLTSDATDEHLLPTRPNILFELGQLQDKVKAGDTVFVLFSGHGMFVNGGSYFLPYDADIRNDFSLSGSAVSDEDIRKGLESLPASAVIIAYDMCRSDPHRSKGDGTNDLGVGEEKRLILQPKSITGKGPDSVVILFSCSPNQRSYEWGAMKRGYFSYFLEQGLRKEAADSTGTVHVSNLVAYLQKAVSATVSREEGQEEYPYPEILGPGASDVILATGLPPGNGGAEAQAVVTNSDDKLYAEAYQKAEELFDAKKYADAQDEFLNAAAVKETAVAVNMAGRCAYIRKDYGKSEKLFRKAMVLDSTYAVPCNNLGAQLYVTGSDTDEAERLLRRAINLDPGLSFAYNNLANLLKDIKKDKAEAERLYRKALELDPNNAYAVDGLGRLFDASAKYDDAEKCYRQAMALDPTYVTPLINLGNENFNARKDYSAAEQWYRKAVALDDSDGQSHAFLACALFKEDKKDDATEEAKRAISLGYKDCWVYKELGLQP